MCDLIADSVLDECLKHDPASRVACEVMATRGHIIVAGEITTSAKPDVFNIVRDTLRDVGYDPKAYQIDCYIHDQSPDIAGAVEPELAEGEDEDTLGAGDQGVMVGYACNETPEYLPMPVVAAQRLVTLLEISRMTGVIPDIGPDGKVQVTMEYNGDTPVRITTVIVSVQHKEDTDIDKLADLLDEYVFPLAFDGIRQMEFLSKHNIDTLAQLEVCRQAKLGEIVQLTAERKSLCKTNPDSPRIQQINTALKQLRQEERLCRKIAEHSLEVQRHLTEARRDRAEQQKQEQERARDRCPNIDMTL